MSFSTLLDHQLTLQRQTTAPDASGGSTRTFSALLTNIPCALAPAAASIVADYARRDMIVDVHIYTTTNLDAAPLNGLHLGDRFTDGSNYYLVKAIKKSANAMISSETIYQADCERRV